MEPDSPSPSRQLPPDARIIRPGEQPERYDYEMGPPVPVVQVSESAFPNESSSLGRGLREIIETVLPAVLSTQELIRSSAWVQRAFGRVAPIPFSNRPLRSWFLLIAAAGGLAVIGIWPNCFFSLVWVAPLLILVALRSLQGECHPLQSFARTDWIGPASAMLAALVCGFFWEMWNAFSLAQWRYSIPFVHRFEIFAMPLLGYAGYLPFGLECAAIADLLEGLAPRAVGPSHCTGRGAAAYLRSRLPAAFVAVRAGTILTSHHAL